jgi:flagellar basal body rod protein FlgB
LAPDPKAVAQSLDSNTVNLEGEMVEMSKNTVLHSVEIQLVSGALLRLKLAITGKT